jgi:hypothetical protein
MLIECRSFTVLIGAVDLMQSVLVLSLAAHTGIVDSWGAQAHV